MAVLKKHLVRFTTNLSVPTVMSCLSPPRRAMTCRPGPYGTGVHVNTHGKLDQSLKRMNLDYVDLFYSHRYDPHTPLDETLQALADIVHQGKALYVGFPWPAEAARYARITSTTTRPTAYIPRKAELARPRRGV